MRVAAPMSYANLAQQDFGALVSRETAILTIGDIVSEQRWNAYGNVERAGSALAVKATGQALPQALPGQSFVSHFTLFTPLRRVCKAGECNPTADYVSPQRLAAAAAAADHLRLDFAISTIDGETQTTSCRVVLHRLAKQALASLNDSAFYGQCHAL